MIYLTILFRYIKKIKIERLKNITCSCLYVSFDIENHPPPFFFLPSSCPSSYSSSLVSSSSWHPSSFRRQPPSSSWQRQPCFVFSCQPQPSSWQRQPSSSWQRQPFSSWQRQPCFSFSFRRPPSSFLQQQPSFAFSVRSCSDASFAGLRTCWDKSNKLWIRTCAYRSPGRCCYASRRRCLRWGKDSWSVPTGCTAFGSGSKNCPSHIPSCFCTAGKWIPSLQSL